MCEEKWKEATENAVQAQDMGQEPKAGRNGAVKEGVRQGSTPRIAFPVFGAASAAYALFYTFCLYKNASGITYPFFVAGTLCYLFFCMEKCRVPSGDSADTASGTLEGQGLKAGNLWKDMPQKAVVAFYAGSLLLLGVSVCLTDDWKIIGMTKTGIFLLTVLLALKCFYRTEGWGFGRHWSAICRSLLEMLHYLDTPFADAAAYFKGRGGLAKNLKIGYVLLGGVTAVPLLVVVLALLLSADAVFLDLFDKMLGDLHPESAVLMGLMTVAAYIFTYSFVRGLTTYRMPERPAKEKRGEPVVAITFTLLLAAIYMVFCGIQVLYLFLGNRRLPEGLTWASYARQGFFQLLFVCLINLALVLVCLAVFRESRILKALLTAISLLTYILIASSAYRMTLYIMHYHMTFLRLFVLWALAVIAVLFAGVIISIYREKFPLFLFGTAVVTVCYLCFAFAKPDYQVARYDLAHLGETGTDAQGDGRRGGFDDYWYLTALSADAAPLLAQEDVRERLENQGALQYYYDKVWDRTKDMGLRDFNVSRWLAQRSLEGWYGEQ